MGAVTIAGKDAFARAVGLLSGGAVASQLLMIAVAPVLTRLYEPVQLGTLAMYAGVVSLLSVIGALRYELAIPLAHDEDAADSLTVLCVAIVSVTSVLVAMAIAVLKSLELSAQLVPELDAFFWLIPVALFVTGIGSVFHYRILRATGYRKIAVVQFSQSAATASIQLAGFKLGSLALILAQIGGQMVASSLLGRTVIRSGMEWRRSWRELARCAFRYRRFPLFSTWTGLLSVANTHVPVLLMAVCFSGSVTGYLALALRVLALPMHVVGQAVTHVYFAAAPRALREGSLAALTREVHGRLVEMALAPMLLLAAVGPDLFAVVFGENWRTAGEYARYLCAWLYLGFVCGPIVRLFEVVDKQMNGTVLQFTMLVTSAAAVLTGGWMSEASLAVQLLTLANLACWAGFLFWVASHLKLPLREFAVPTMRELPIAFACVAPVWLGPLSGALSWMMAFAISLGLVILRAGWMLKNAASAEGWRSAGG